MTEQNIDYDRILDEGLLRLQIRRAIMKATSGNDMVDAELSKPEYQGILRPQQEYLDLAGKRVAEMNLR